MTIKLSVNVKDGARTVSEKEMVEDGYVLSVNNKDLMDRVQRAYNRFKEEGDTDPPRIEIKASLLVQK